jgi:RNA polymerase sigma-70 factor (ECF subfamily)
LVQETFLKLCADDFRLLRRFRVERPEALGAYLRVVASSVVADSERTRRAQKRGAGSEPADIESETLGAPASNDFAEQLERKVLFEQVDHCLGSESDRDRHIFWLYYRHGLTARAIAAIQIIQLTASGVESLIRRLTIVVKTCLKIGASRGISAGAKWNRA